MQTLVAKGPNAVGAPTFTMNERQMAKTVNENLANTITATDYKEHSYFLHSKYEVYGAAINTLGMRQTSRVPT